MKKNLDLNDFLSAKSVRPAIDLSGYNLDDEGARTLGRYLTQDKTLKKLNLQWNAIWTDGAQALALALANNSTLEVLNLSHNSIRSTGAEHIATALKANKGLKTLILCDNDIDDLGLAHILDALEYNVTLKSLEIEGNPIHDTTLKQKILERIGYNHTKEKGGQTVNQVQPPDQADQCRKLNNALDQQKAQNNNLKKRLDKLTTEMNGLKQRVEVQGGVNQSLMDQLDASLKERVVLEKKAQTLSRQVETEKGRANVLMEAARKKDGLEAEHRKLQQQVNLLTSERRSLRHDNDLLTKQLSTLSGSSAACEQLDLPVLANLEGQLEASLRNVRAIRTQRLQRKLDEVQETKRCKVCFEGSVETVLIPCGHHVLCLVCSEKVVKCPICNSQIQNRIRTFEC